MIHYQCYDIKLEDGSFLQEEWVVTVSKVDMSDPLDRQDHLTAISGTLESVVGRDIESFSYMRIEDVA
jgi:hypothetical protein